MHVTKTIMMLSTNVKALFQMKSSYIIGNQKSSVITVTDGFTGPYIGSDHPLFGYNWYNR